MAVCRMICCFSQINVRKHKTHKNKRIYSQVALENTNIHSHTTEKATEFLEAEN